VKQNSLQFALPIEYQVVTEVPAEQVIALYQDAGWWNESPQAKAVIPKMVRGSFCFMVAVLEGEIIGMGRVISDGASDAYIQDVVVKNAFRKNGIGLELIRRLTQKVKEAGIEWIGLIAEPYTKKKKKKNGYQELVNYVAMRKM